MLSAIGVGLAMVLALVAFVAMNRRAPNGMLRPFVNLVQYLTIMLMFDADFGEALRGLSKVLAGMSLGIDVVSPRCAGLGTTFFGRFAMLVAMLLFTVAALTARPIATKPQSVPLVSAATPPSLRRRNTRSSPAPSVEPEPPATMKRSVPRLANCAA